ncbi:MAG: tRNA (adenosine(37)-N6)-dimethylallyltransferase MiaA, partial [Intestinibacter sp.]|uniref:tRNA (adenosine(37)-N6)-dimethylallyltransferase MiaA n=1 Tax=Intestinibacter sp. TaxID=1965304 RepID=UPI003F15BB29
MKKIPLIILTGPTAVGKTDLSIKLAKSLDAEIISADSMQIYKYMDIGSAKVTEEEMDGVVHYMIDEVTPDVPFSVSEFQSRSEKYIDEIHAKGKNIIVTGGTGLYLNSLIYDMDFAKSNANSEIREKLEAELKENGIDYMHEKLKSLDEEAANRIHKNNTKRVIRAIEVCLSGQKMSDFSRDLKYNEKYKPIIIILNRD